MHFGTESICWNLTDRAAYTIYNRGCAVECMWKSGKAWLVAGIFVLIIVDCLLLYMIGFHYNRREENTVDTQYRSVSAQISVKEDSTMNEKKKIAITFDDGPNEIYTEPLLDGLKERGAKATFFLLGNQIEKNPELVKRIHSEGHLIGNHTYEHPDLSQLSVEDAKEQIDSTNKLIYDLIGSYPQYIRPPYGNIKEGIHYDPQMIEVLWTIDSRDWAVQDINEVIQNVLTNAEENGVILMHDSSEMTVQAAFTIIDSLQNEGYSFVTLDEIIFE